MEVIWITEKVVDDRDVITHVRWTATAWEGVWRFSESGVDALPQPDATIVAAYWRPPTEEQLAEGVDWEDLPDPPGFVRPEWVERDTLQPWLFAIIDKAAIERGLVEKVRAASSAQGS